MTTTVTTSTPALQKGTARFRTALSRYQKNFQQGNKHNALKKRAHTNNYVLAAFLAAALVIFVSAVMYPLVYDNDVWFFLATGEYIVNNGIPYTNPFSIQPDLGFVAQQWLHCVFSYVLYKAGGFPLMGVWTMVQIVLFAFSLFCVGKKLRRNTYGIEVLAILIVICIFTSSSYMTVRPHLYSMIAYTWVVWACESYRQSNNVKYLFVVPAIALVHVNLHAALAPYDLFILACYAVPNMLPHLQKKGLCKTWSLTSFDYKRLPLLICIGVSFCVLFINPYGVKGALYLVYSFGSVSSSDGISIKEMNHLAPAGNVIFVTASLLMFAACATVVRFFPKRINLPLTLLVIVGTVSAFMYLRNIWLGTLFSTFYLMWATRTQSITFEECACLQKFAKPVSAALLGLGLVGMVVFVRISIPQLQQLPKDDSMTPVNTMQFLDKIKADKETTKVMCFFNAGGYVEYCGYKVNIDPRPEIWNSLITGKDFNYFTEYSAMAKGTTIFNLYDMKYQFDVYIIPSDAGTDSYFAENNKQFVEIEGGDGYRAYANKKWIKQYTTEYKTIKP